MRIAGSPPGLRFDVVVAPNTFIKQKKSEERKFDESIGLTRTAYWTAFNEALQVEPGLSDCQRRYGGRLGFEWLLPIVADDWNADEPHVLVYITAGPGNHGIGTAIECRKGAREEALSRLEAAKRELSQKDVAPGKITADLTTEVSLRAAVREHLGKASLAAEALRRAFTS